MGQTEKLQEVQGLMVFLASMAKGLEEVLGRGASAISYRAGRTTRRKREVTASETGDLALAEGVVPRLLREIYVGRRSGTLSLVRGKERQSLRFRHGHIVNAHTNVLEERLGEMLVRRGLLARPTSPGATEAVVRDRRRLGEVLLEMGLLDASGLEDAVALHVHEMLTRVFAWTDGTYAFDEEAEGGDQVELTLKLSTGELILESVQAVKDPDVVRYALGDMDRVLVLSADPLLRFQKLTLSTADGFVLSRVDGVTSAREVVQMIPLPAEQTQKSLLGLLSTGIVEYADARRPREASRAVLFWGFAANSLWTFKWKEHGHE